jgi:ERCC4-type nuclease
MLKVDHREGKIKELIQPSHPCAHVFSTITYENLEFGDFQIFHPTTKNIHFILERKTLDDLLASVKDGRYTNQKARLLQQFQPSQIIYIIEGLVKWNSSTTDVKQKILQSAVINTLLRDHISVIQTKSVAETFEFVLGLYQRFVADPEKYPHHLPSSTTNTTVEEQTIVQTSKDSDARHIFRKVLCQIPNMSDKSATAFLEKWTSFAAMYSALSSLDTQSQINVLSELKVNGRKISKRIVENTVLHLFTSST